MGKQFAAQHIMTEKTVEDYLSAIKLLQDKQSTAAACILGAAVGDAAARPLHWVYDRSEMEKILQENRAPEFWPENKSPFYSLPTGERSCYNYVVMAGLEAFIACKVTEQDFFLQYQ